MLKEQTNNPRINWAYLPYSMHMAGPRGMYMCVCVCVRTCVFVRVCVSVHVLVSNVYLTSLAFNSVREYFFKLYLLILFNFDFF